jgi:hypothetical protein
MNRLYIRIWLAVVLAVAVLTLLVGWAWRMASDAPLRDVVARNQAARAESSGLGDATPCARRSTTAPPARR